MVTDQQIGKARKDVATAKTALDFAEQTLRDLCDLQQSEQKAEQKL